MAIGPSHWRRRLTLLGLLASSSCDAPSGDRTHQYDEGTLCINVGPQPFGAAEGSVTQLSEGAPLTFAVSSQGCLSASCDVEREAMCVVMQEGNTLTVKSVLRWRTADATSCTADCGKLSAECGGPPLPAGTYTVRFGEKERTITVPSLLSEPCID